MHRAAHGNMREKLEALVCGFVRRVVHDIVQAPVQSKVCRTRGYNDTCVHSAVH